MNNSPYKFLDFYDIDDQKIFFGREREANILVADIVVNRLVVLFARTGTGKTSLMNAGVRPRLEEKGFRTFYIRVEQDPTKAARDVLRKEHLLNEEDDTTSLSKQLCDVVESLDQPIVLFFDQFEEFFLHLDDKTRQDFIRDISEVYRNADSGVHLVFSMREEYYFRMDEFRDDIPSIFHKNSNLRLLPLDEEQSRAAIIKPAGVLDVQVDLDLANEIINDLKNDKEGIRAPSLQIICDTLWRKEDPQDRHITLQDYEELGRGQSILDKRLAEDLEQALADAPGPIHLMQLLIPELITNRNTKYPRLLSDLVSKLNTNEKTLDDLIARLKGVGIIKQMTISGDEAIEWASDYLAERTELLLGIIKTIELRAILQAALQQSTESEETKPENDQANADLQITTSFTEWRLPLAKFMELSENNKSIENLQRNEIEFLFDTALFYQRNMKDWFGRLPGSHDDLEILRTKIHDKDTNLKVRKGVIVLLGSLATPAAIQLLEEALDEPTLIEETIMILIGLSGEQVDQILAKSLDRDDLWEEVVAKLKGSETERSIMLLKPLLDLEPKFFRALNAFEQLAKTHGQLGKEAKEVLETTIPQLEAFLKDDEKFLGVCSSLGRLAKFEGQLGDKAIHALTPALPALTAKLKQDPKFFNTLNVLEQLLNVKDPVGGEAEKALESAIPLLGTKLKDNPTPDVERTLARLAKIQKPFGRAAQEILDKSKQATADVAKDRAPAGETPLEESKDISGSDQPVGTSQGTIEEIPARKDTPGRLAEQAPSEPVSKGGGLRRRIAPANQISETDPFDELMTSIRKGNLVPVISNSLRIDQIFSEEQSLANRLSGVTDESGEDLSIFEELTREWAQSIEYPMMDTHDLARVAQYFQVEQVDILRAKSEYLRFLRRYLLAITEEDVSYQEIVQQLRRSEDVTFSKTVRELDYPRFPSGSIDPLRLLARLPLKLYITTSFYDFLEVALLAEGKQPRTQLCLWSGGRLSLKPEHQPDPYFEPSEASPVVYHLYGLEDYSQTLVLSEDDYLNFLFSIAEDTNTQNPILPLMLRESIAESQLLLLGYRSKDWDFRMLFKLIAKYRSFDFGRRGVLIHLKPASTGDSEGIALQYLSRYFDKNRFAVTWSTTERFIHQLWDKWNAYQEGTA